MKKTNAEEKTKHNALALVDCTIHWEFEAPADATPEQIEEIAWRECPGAGLCHQCADTLYVGDVGELVEIDGESVKPCPAPTAAQS